jgi:V-type H+-transporting ATPase subunit F
MLLAGVGNVDTRQKKNFFVVDSKTTPGAVEEAFKDLTNRKDIAILLINQHVADMVRHLIEDYNQMMPSLLEIPSKDHPYDPEKDSILKRVNRLFAHE